MNEENIQSIETMESESVLPSPDESTKVAPKSNKKIIILGIAVITLAAIVALIFILTAPIRKYKKAMAHIEEQKYEEAYEILSGINHYKPAKEALGRFHYVVSNVKTYLYFSDGRTLLYETKKYSYGTNGLPTYINKNGIKTKYTYDDEGRLIKTIDEHSRETVFTYDNRGNLINETLTYHNIGERQITDYTYDANNNLTKTVCFDTETSSLVFSMEYFYNSSNNLVKTVYTYSTGECLTTVYTYNDDNKLTKAVNEFTPVYHPEIDDSYITVVNTSPDSMEYFYNSKGQLIEVVSTFSKGDNRVANYEYDEHGNLICYNDPTFAFPYEVECEYTLVYIPYDNICKPVEDLIFANLKINLQ